MSESLVQVLPFFPSIWSKHRCRSIGTEIYDFLDLEGMVSQSQ